MIAQPPIYTTPCQMVREGRPTQSCHIPPCTPLTQSSPVEFDVGSQPHLTPRYTQGAVAMSNQHESAHSLPRSSASFSAPPYYPCLVNTQQTPVCRQRLQLGTRANTRAATGPVRSRGVSAAACIGKGHSPSKMPSVDTCCMACGRAYESQPVDTRWSAICWDSQGFRSRAWGTNGAVGSLPEESKAQLAGSTSRALGRLALKLRYCPMSSRP